MGGEIRADCKDWGKAEFLELLINAFSEGIIALNSQGKVLFCNKVIEDVFGLKVKDLIGKELHSLFIKDDKLLAKVKEEFKIFASTGTGPKFHQPVELNAKVGDIEKKIQLVLKSMKFKGEWIAVGILSDVTKQRKLELEILRSDKRFQLLMESIKEGIFLLNEDGVLIDANPYALKMVGCNSKFQLLGKTPYDLSPERQPNGTLSKEMALNKIKAAISGQPQYFEWILKRLDNGSLIYCAVTLSMVDLVKEKFLLVVARDITSKKMLEKELKKKNKLILELSETAPVGIVRFSPKGEIEYMNPKAREILGYLAGGPFEQRSVKSVLERYKLWSLIEESSKFNKQKITQFPINIDNKRTMWIEAIVDFIEMKENSPVRMILRDITSEKMVEFAKESEQKKTKILIESLPHPAWLITKQRKIIAQNKAAEMWGSKVGEYCWKSVWCGKYIPSKARETIERTGTPPPGIKCMFCRADEALMIQEFKEKEVDIEGKAYNMFWIPVDKDLFLHYILDVTKYVRLQEKLMDLSTKDALTGLYNRRFFEKRFEEEKERSKRFSKTFSIIMLDIDDFKKINDTYGHNVGDEVLISVAKEITNRIRKIDVPVRWGGEEFVILLPETRLKDALVVAEDIRASIKKLKVSKIENITASFGVAEYRAGDNLYTLINRADEQLYKAKRKGKNQVCYEEK